MRFDIPFSRRGLIVWGCLLGIGAMVGPVLVAWSGVYHVAASRGHPEWLNQVLELGMERSVAVHSASVNVPPLDEPGMVALGAGHFAAGCASCHGGPGEPVNPVYDHMLPSPPKLEEHADDWEAGQLYWIVRHGLQYAGMPGWSGEGRGDEVWPMVAFLRVLPELDETAYEDLARGNMASVATSPDAIAETGRSGTPMTACARCHDTPQAPPTSVLVPRLGGQSEAYLLRALQAYKHDTRQSGYMEPVASELEEDDFAPLAAYYATMTSPPPEAEPASAELVAAGRVLAERGNREAGVPACGQCHGAGASPEYPRLAAQPAAYLEAQLALWRAGGRTGTDHGRLMAVIAERLTPEEAQAAAAYYQSLAPPQPAPAGTSRDSGEGAP